MLLFKNPENYFAILGYYAYEPFRWDYDTYVLVAHRGEKKYRAIVKLSSDKAAFTSELVYCSMPDACVPEFTAFVARNGKLLTDQAWYKVATITTISAFVVGCLASLGAVALYELGWRNRQTPGT